jgi:hypothetical protein
MTKMNIKKAVEHIIDFVKLTVTTVGGTILILMLLGVVSIPAQAHHGSNEGTSTRFVQCVEAVCQNKGETGLHSKMIVSRVKDSPAVIVWLQGSKGRANSLNFGPIELLSQHITTIGVDVGYQINNDVKVGSNWAGPGRWSKDYVARVKSIVLWARQEFGLPVFIMGHSAGAQGVSGFLLMEEGNQSLVAGAIWSGGHQMAPYPGKQGLTVQQFNIPALIIHHEKDRCPSTSFREAEKRYKKYISGMNAGPTELIRITGGEETWKGAGKDPRGCGVQADAHGYVGVKDVFTEQVIKFILKYSQ